MELHNTVSVCSRWILITWQEESEDHYFLSQLIYRFFLCSLIIGYYSLISIPYVCGFQVPLFLNFKSSLSDQLTSL